MELTDPGVLVGYLAAFLVFSSFYMKTMLPLRTVAIASNIGFLIYGAINNLTPILILHAILLPLNMVRTWEICRTLSRIRKTRSGGIPLGTILPLMNSGQKCRGEILFRRGDEADRLYILTAGEIRLLELDLTILPGSFCGEIGLFSPLHRRTATAMCTTDVTFHSLTSAQVDTIFYQNPDFGYALLGMLTHRLVTNVECLESRLRILGRPTKTE